LARQGISRNNCGPDSVAAAEENLVELGLDYVDLLLVHFPPAGGCGELNCNIIKQQWSALQVQQSLRSQSGNRLRCRSQ
jgi:diketogulonate reductase-like aldo/keto reductase